jgi:hypothetical protein
MTTGQKHEAIAAQYYKEMNAKANATVYHYSISTVKPNKEFIKAWLLKRRCNSLSEFLDYEEMF